MSVQLAPSSDGHPGVLQAMPPQLTRLDVSWGRLLDTDSD
jgi:hypothetical protein